MAAGFPTKVTYANGDVFNASDINDTNGTLNYIDPTSATDRQVLTRDNASPGKVKWVNSPANTLTTTGDLYYASAANTPARLGIGTTGQLLVVSGGLPAWTSVSSGCTLIQNVTGTGTTFSISSIPQTYTHLMLIGRWETVTGLTLTTQTSGTTNYSSNYSSFASTWAYTNSASSLQLVNQTADSSAQVIFVPRYSQSNGQKLVTFHCVSGTAQPTLGGGRITYTTASGITTITLTLSGSSAAYNYSLFGLSQEI